ncbi:hypothetical protein SYNTR_0195 [Candidatus Syntrophocurvum alkaliphilum]|uniref:Uncharacterized protein n=1 Tax=Candidatus Syntrophocurvum alkaliphilum TaxID=2293317 RepID=A0A6I6DDW4_9FIRM|nr:hypothetical protein [Candidatus Syntrophocurvum alkaliphilum]QGT98788.1 hypothetical protein SYNTR_0195 [Candidatus Syntrophocurvum alkaliphilum]
MEYAGALAPIAFVFAVAALVKIDSLKKEVQHLKSELDKLKR